MKQDKTIIYTRHGKKWRKKAFKNDYKALKYIERHEITEYEDEFGIRTLHIGGMNA